MKKIVSILMCVVCLACVFSGCGGVVNESESTSLNTKVKKDVAYQEDVTNVFKIEKCVLDEGESELSIQLRNDTDKTIGSYKLLIQYLDDKNNIVEEIVCTSDYVFQTKPGDLTYDIGYYIKRNPKCVKVKVYVANIYYQNDGGQWTNKGLVLSKESQLIVTMEKEVEGIYSVEQCKADILKLELQIKNCSPNKTISSYSVVVRYLDSDDLDKDLEYVLDYRGAPVKPSDISEKSVWGLYHWKYRKPSCYVSEIVYSDGTKWSNPIYQHKKISSSIK